MHTEQKTIFVGLSGGVDSAVSAALLKERGHRVVGAFIRIALPGDPCTAGADRIDAMRVAAHLEIPFVEIDLSKEYEQRVFEASIGGFEKGETPNPDILCNREIKFGLFYEWARSQGADFIATGHYAQAKDGALLAGADPDKDQSYFLWSVSEDALLRTLFPVGDKVKVEVRALAKKFGLPNATRPDSQGLCFLGPISVSDMLERELELSPGAVLNEAGETVGEHEGAARYTLGQRHGFTLTEQGPEMSRFDSTHRKPHYVIGKNLEKNTITVSTERFPQKASKTAVMLREENWIGTAPEGRYAARYRYRQALIPAEVRDSTVLLHEPHFVPRGQSLVLYDGERCLGGGIVDSTELKP